MLNYYYYYAFAKAFTGKALDARAFVFRDQMISKYNGSTFQIRAEHLFGNQTKSVTFPNIFDSNERNESNER